MSYESYASALSNKFFSLAHGRSSASQVRPSARSRRGPQDWQTFREWEIPFWKCLKSSEALRDQGQTSSSSSSSTSFPDKAKVYGVHVSHLVQHVLAPENFKGSQNCRPLHHTSSETPCQIQVQIHFLLSFTSFHCILCHHISHTITGLEASSGSRHRRQLQRKPCKIRCMTANWSLGTLQELTAHVDGQHQFVRAQIRDAELLSESWRA